MPHATRISTALAAAVSLALALSSHAQTAPPAKAGTAPDVLPAAATQNMPAAAAVRQHPAELPLWPAGQVPNTPANLAPDATAEVVAWRTEKDTITGDAFSFPTVTNTHNPSLTPYLPKTPAPAGGFTAVIVAPGGGHQFHTINHEGYDIAQSLADHGIAAFVLKYRLARAASYPRNTYTIERDALADGQRSVRSLRARAAEFHLNPDKIGMMGFSAGGEVAIQVSLNSPEGKPDAADPIDKLSSKLNFEAFIYPGNSRGLVPTKEWPPAFLACSFDDRADIAGPVSSGTATSRPAAQGLADVYLRYKAVGVSAELHIYSTGGHGFGARNRPIEEAGWLNQFTLWLTDRGF